MCALGKGSVNLRSGSKSSNDLSIEPVAAHWGESLTVEGRGIVVCT